MGTIKDTTEIVTEVLKAAGENEDVKAAGAELGKAALTISKTINNALLPLAAVNYAFERGKEYFAERFPADMAEAVADVPPSDLVEPKASLAGPALQGLAFSHEEHELRRLYLGLLATSMDGRVASLAHPAFVEVLRQLTAHEVNLLTGLLTGSGNVAIVQIRREVDGKPGWKVLRNHVAQTEDLDTGDPIPAPDFPSFVDNWVRLGLVTVAYDAFLTGDASYAWADSRPELLELREEHEAPGVRVMYQRGLLSVTDLGRRFADAVGMGRKLLPAPRDHEGSPAPAGTEEGM